MRCDEIQEHLVDLLYDRDSAARANQELQDHLRCCAACRGEFEALTQTRERLKEWKDEPPLRSVSLPRRDFTASRRTSWNFLRYAAVAAMVLLCVLALANTEITLNDSGFSVRTNLFRRDLPEREYYTKSEIRDMMKRALDDSEMRTNEVNYLMLQKMLDTLARDPWMDSRLVRGSAAHSGNRN